MKPFLPPLVGWSLDIYTENSSILNALMLGCKKGSCQEQFFGSNKGCGRGKFESPTSEIFVPEGKGTDICIFFAPPQPQEWQLGKVVSYNSKSCSEGCCFYTPASSKRVQEIEAEVEKNLPTWFRTPAGGCDAVPSRTITSRLILNEDNNDSGNEAALCVKAKDKDTFELLTGETTSCKGKCCVFNCKSCKAPES